MRKALIVAAIAAAAMSTASANKVGAYVLGGQYTQNLGNGNSLRYGLGLPGLSLFRGGGIVAVNGDVSYLVPFNSAAVPTPGGVDLYYGGSVGVGAVFGKSNNVSYTTVAIIPSVLAGAEYNINDRFSVFGEASLGFGIALSASNVTGASTGAGFAPGLRLGVNYRLN